MKRTRHQFAPAMPAQKVIDRAVAGSVPDGLLIGHLEIMDVQHLSGPGGLGEARQQGLLLGHRHVLALASAARLGLERLDPAVVIGHVRPVHRAQRDTHGRCNRRLRHPALAQQYHLDALTLHGGNFPAQRRLQLPDLGLAAFDHLFPLRIRWSERITPCSSKTIPFSRIRNQHKNRRFNQLWKRYETCQFARKHWQLVIVAICETRFEDEISSFLVAKVTQSLAKGIEPALDRLGRREQENPNPEHLSRLLRVGGRHTQDEGNRKDEGFHRHVPAPVPDQSRLSRLAGCCARAASGHATDAPPSKVMNSRRFITRSPRRRAAGWLSEWSRRALWRL